MEKKKTPREIREKKIPFFINEENKMDPEILNSFLNNNQKPKPVIELNEDEIMPLYIFIAKFKSGMAKPGEKEIYMNLMMTIIHLKKTNTLEIRARMKYENTGRKTIFTIPKNLKLKNLEIAKEIINEFYTGMAKKLPFKITEKPTELNFEINETIKNTIKKLNNSNQFDIGQAKEK